MHIRNNARAFILNENKEILLLKFCFDFTNQSKMLWVTPGGAVEKGENYKQALERELFEELGISVTVNSSPVLTLDIPFNGKHGDFISHEVYYLINLPNNIILSSENMTTNEIRTFQNLKWWCLKELNSTMFEFEPRQHILQLLEDSQD